MLSGQSSTDFLQVAYRPALGQFTGRWLRSVAKPELHQGSEAQRRAAQHRRGGHWLLASRRRTNRRCNGPEWVATQFLPRVQRELGVPLGVFFLVLPDYLSSQPASAHEVEASGPVQFARFLNEGAANAWLAARPAART